MLYEVHYDIDGIMILILILL